MQGQSLVAGLFHKDCGIYPPQESTVGQAVRIVVQSIDSLLSLSWPRRLSGRPLRRSHTRGRRPPPFSARFMR
jgi:hypothetical protein